MNDGFYLTQAQIDEIRVLRDAGVNAEGNYSHIYQHIGDLLAEQGGPADVTNWFRGAEQANAGTGAFCIWGHNTHIGRKPLDKVMN